MKRLAWLVGPPGAGKSTFAESQKVYPRTVEINAMLSPLTGPLRIRKGILSAQAGLVEIIRALEHHPENLALPPLLVVAGLVPEEALFPLRSDEEVLLILPERARWERQLRGRPAEGGPFGQYDDVEYSSRWYGQFQGWVERGLPVTAITTEFQPELIGGMAGG